MTSTMEKRFSESALRSLEYAQSEATYRPQEHKLIGTEHLLLALFSTSESFDVLNMWLGITRPIVEEYLSTITRPIPKSAKVIQLSPHLKQAIKFALQEARERVHLYVFPSHLLLGLTHVPDSKAISIFSDLGIDIKEIRRQTERLLIARKDLLHERKDLTLRLDNAPHVRLIQGNEGQKWNLHISIIETEHNETVTDFSMRFNEFWGWYPHIQMRVFAAVSNKEVGEIYTHDLNNKHRMIVSLEETQT
jgi:ATP-dependent Clp protease ATP-binding subunit ClpA